MQTRALRTFVTVAQTGSFSAAADALNMTLSTVSMQLMSLEKQLGVDLFDRSFRPPKLTATGLDISTRAATMIEAEDDLLSACSNDGELRGTYRIGFVATASIRLLPDFLMRVQANAPHAQFDIQTGLSQALEDKIGSGQLDAAVVTASPDAGSQIDYRLLRREQILYAAPKTMSDKPLDALFETLPFFHFLPDTGIGKIIATRLAGHGRKPAERIYLDSVEAIMECVNKQLGFTLLPEPDIRRYLGESACIIEPEGPAAFRDLALATSGKGRMTSLAEDIAKLFA